MPSDERMAELRQLAEDFRANEQKLAGCARHDFRDITPDKRVMKHFRCSRCDGEASRPDVTWYARGLAHAKAPAGR